MAVDSPSIPGDSDTFKSYIRSFIQSTNSYRMSAMCEIFVPGLL